MFSSKSRGKWAWALVDLFVVIIGVYIAFLIQSTATEQKDEREQIKVLSGLKYELEVFRILFPGRADYAIDKVEQWKKSEQNESYVDFSNWIFIEPQYPYQVVKYALELENADIIDFELYNAIQKVYDEITSLEHADRLIMETSRMYKRLHEDMTGQERLSRSADNYENFQFFIRFFEVRAESLSYLAEASNEALKIINERLSLEERKAIEASFMKDNIEAADSEQEAIGIGQLYFPHFETEEIQKIYQEATQKSQETTSD